MRKVRLAVGGTGVVGARCITDTAAIDLRFAYGALAVLLLSDAGASPKSRERPGPA